MPLAQQKLYTIDDIYALPEGQRAELIDGHIYYMAPPSRRHQQILLSLSRNCSISFSDLEQFFVPLLLPQELIYKILLPFSSYICIKQFSLWVRLDFSNFQCYTTTRKFECS